MLDAFAVGPDIAAQILITAGDNADRVHSEAAFAKLCGTSPVPTGSGRTSGRRRLNRGGNRQANAALYRAVIVRMRWHEPTIVYVQRRTAEGLSNKDIIRCLKRYVARDLYHLLPGLSTTNPTAATPNHQLELHRSPLTIYRSINALAESFNGLYKWELIHRQGPWTGITDVEFATMTNVDWFNHHHRRHGSITPGAGYTTPAAHEAAHYRQPTPTANAVTQ